MNYDSVPLRDFKELNDWETVIFVYQSALKQIETKINILNGEFQHRHKYNPIEHVKSRIKTPESIVKKLKRHGYESSIENMVRYVNDIAGIRISCSFTSDIYLCRHSGFHRISRRCVPGIVSGTFRGSESFR